MKMMGATSSIVTVAFLLLVVTVMTVEGYSNSAGSCSGPRGGHGAGSEGKGDIFPGETYLIAAKVDICSCFL